ncbi:hypothetical protein [Paenibacillus durus]|uniref:Lipocalin-like domain-containing protein n=1 Tax=Paenibacillus durus TaxID=44251 RepID=A0A089HUV1_PAEDU|nr:hypothetical protein [Paenibacillus durus]AIQ14540.1 hypothetical protein PDUR_23600 [Paenibacillus durus]
MKIGLLAVILIMNTFLSTACGTKIESTKPVIPSTVAETSDSSLSPKLDSIQSIMGTWKIVHVYAYGQGGSSNDEDDIKKLIGTEISFSSNSIKFGGEAEVKPIYYKVSKSSDEKFLSDIYWLQESTDLNVETLKEISIYHDESLTDFYYGSGNITYLSDKGDFLIDEGGDIFELVKKK